MVGRLGDCSTSVMSDTQNKHILDARLEGKEAVGRLAGWEAAATIPGAMNDCIWDRVRSEQDGEACRISAERRRQESVRREDERMRVVS